MATPCSADDEPTLTDLPPVIAEEANGQLAIDVGSRRSGTAWKLPPITSLKKGTGQNVDKRAVDAAGAVLQAALQQHGVDAKLIGATVGPTVTRYELELAPGVKVSRITGWPTTSRTRWRRPTSGSSPRSPADPRSASRCRTANVSS